MEEKQTVSCMEENQDEADTTKPLGVGVEGMGALCTVFAASIEEEQTVSCMEVKQVGACSVSAFHDLHGLYEKERH